MLRSIPSHWPAWLVATVAFPIGGVAASALIGPATTAVSALLAGAVAGLAIGAGQALAMTPRRPSVRWIAATAVGSGAGLAIGVGLGLEPLPMGLVTGALVGAGQAAVLVSDKGHAEVPAAAAAWVGVTAAAWGLGWLVTTFVGVDANAGWAVFGSSGALTAQVVTLLGAVGLGRRTAAVAA